MGATGAQARAEEARVMNTAALVDSNIVIDWLRGVPQAARELAQYRRVHASIITRIEVLAGAPPAERERIRELIAPIDFIELDVEIADAAAAIRHQRRIKVPDAIIEATARCRGLLLVTRNSKDFPADLAGVRIPYVVAP